MRTKSNAPTEARLLHELVRHGPQSRAKLASSLGVMRSTVGTQVNKLLKSGLLRDAHKADTEQTGAGRPGSLLDINPHHRSFIGIDLGVGHLRGVLVDMAGHMLAETSEEVPFADQTPREMSTRIARILTRLKRKAPALDGAMISVPGIVNSAGTIVRLPRLDWQDVCLLDYLTEELPDFGPIDIDNDANVFARGELLSVDEHDGSIIYFWMDSGIGAGIVVNNTLLAGANGQAGEMGHMFARALGGQTRARLDDITSVPAILRNARSNGLPVETIADLVARVDQNDPKALQVLEAWADTMSETFSSLASLFDPKSMILSGPLAALLEHALPQVEQKTRDLLYHGTVMPALIVRKHRKSRLAMACATIRRNAFLSGA